MTSTPFRRRLRTASFALFLGLTPVVAPVVAGFVPVAAEARPGGGTSMGSRGSRTYSAPPVTNTNPGGAMPFQRSLAPRAGTYGNGYGSNYGGGAGGLGGGMRAHPFATGLMGGLIGAGIGGMLFGHGFFGGGGYGYGGGFGLSSLLGLLIQLAILFFVVRWLLRRFTGARGGSAPAGFGGGRGLGNMAGAGAGNAALPITPADYAQFEQNLLDVQQAWSMQDLRSLSRFATPEMVSYFSEQLADLSSRNLRNAVSAVRMEQGDLSEAWRENGREFATVAMRYSLIDVTTDLTGRVVDGSPNERQTVVELWTFVRAPGGNWLLSAIQQTR